VVEERIAMTRAEVRESMGKDGRRFLSSKADVIGSTAHALLFNEYRFIL
jgi:hypothetical protein